MANRELLMLAQTFDPAKHRIAGWYVSVKYDGQRAFWDGGVTRGIRKAVIPWANNAKDERYVNDQIATGLWSRYGNVIHAPDSFLDELPEGVCLDGELWYERGQFQTLRKIVSTLQPKHSLWDKIKFIVFEQPPIEVFCLNGKINNPQFIKHINYTELRPWFDGFQTFVPMFEDLKPISSFGRIEQIEQIILPNREDLALAKLYDLLEEETDKGGEGLMVRDPMSCYQIKRTRSLLKVKPFEIDTGVVKGWTPGVGKYEGMMGSLIVEWNEKRFNLSGFTDDERKLIDGPQGQYPPHFPTGQAIKFKYVSLTNDGIPREARYQRTTKV